MRAQLLPIAALCAVTALAALQPTWARAAADEDRLVFAPADDPAMDKAMSDARANLDAFFAAHNENDGDNEDFAVKLARTTPRGGEEHVWVSVEGMDGNQFVGELLNEPADLPGLELGSEMVFEIDDIEDWTYTRGGKAYGHFTTRVLFDHASTAEEKAEAKEVLDMLWPTPLPPRTH